MWIHFSFDIPIKNDKKIKYLLPIALDDGQLKLARDKHSTILSSLLGPQHKRFTALVIAVCLGAECSEFFMSRNNGYAQEIL